MGTSFSIPKGEKYIPNKVIHDIVNGSKDVVLIAPPGTGKSYGVLDHLKSTGDSFVFAADTKALADQLSHEHQLPVYYNGKAKPTGNQIITIYDHAHVFQRDDRLLIVDEFHSMVTDYTPRYRRKAIQKVHIGRAGYQRTIGLTACRGFVPEDWESVEVKSHDAVSSVELLSYENALAAVIGEVTARPGSRHFISLFDTGQYADKVKKTLERSFESEAILKINSGTIDHPSAKKLLQTGRIPKKVKIVLCTYRQGFSIRDTDFTCHVVPAGRLRHSPEDILQVTRRFRNGVQAALVYARCWQQPESAPETFNRSWHRRNLVREAKKKAQGVDAMLSARKTGSRTEKSVAKYFKDIGWKEIENSRARILLQDDLTLDPLGLEHMLYKQRAHNAYTDRLRLQMELNRVDLSVTAIKRASEATDVAPASKTSSGFYCDSKTLGHLADRFERLVMTPISFDGPEDEREAQKRYNYLYWRFRGDYAAVKAVFIEYCTSPQKWNALQRRVKNLSSSSDEVQEVRRDVLQRFPTGSEHTSEALERQVKQLKKTYPALRSSTPKKPVTFLKDHVELKRSRKEQADGCKKNVYVVESHDPIGYKVAKSWN